MLDWYLMGLLMVCSLILLSMLGFPLAACLGGTGFIFMVLGVGIDQAAGALNKILVEFAINYTIVAVPMFVFMAEFLFAGGVTEGLFDMASKWLRRLPGGLALATIGGCAIFGTMSGSTLSAITTFGLVSVPQMLKRGYNKQLATGVVASAGSLAHLIPPSIMAVVYASLVEISPAKQLMAGFIPGFLLAFAFVVVVLIWVRVNPKIAPPEPPSTWKEKWESLRKIISPIIIVIIVLGVIYTGISTVTEAAAIGAFAALLLALVTRKLNRQTFMHTLLQSARITAFITFIAVGGKFFGWVLNYYTVPQHLAEMMVVGNWNRWVVMAAIQVLYIIMGCFIDPMGIMFTTVPIFVPITIALGFDPIWYGVLFLVNMELAHVTPPLGFGLFIIKGIAPDEVTLNDVLWGSMRFCIGTVVVIALIMIFPDIALFIPNQMK